MESKSILGYIIFGTQLRYLQDVKEDWPAHREDMVIDNIERFQKCLEDFGLIVTQRATGKLKGFLEKLKKTDKDHELSADEAKKLNNIMNMLRETLVAESSGKVAFIVTDKRIDVNKLLDDMPSLFGPDVFDALPDIAQYDFIQAGKCIAFELPTSAAFHLLRGTESLVKELYCTIVKRQRVDLMWGPMIQHLKQRNRRLPRPLLENLDNIRLSFRNPTQHPEKIYDIHEVQDLCGLCIDAVNRLVRFL